MTDKEIREYRLALRFAGLDASDKDAELLYRISKVFAKKKGKMDIDDLFTIKSDLDKKYQVSEVDIDID